jgi:hypothetical protein
VTDLIRPSLEADNRSADLSSSLSAGADNHSLDDGSHVGQRLLAGRLVHRLCERFGTSLAGRRNDEAISAELARLLRDDEAVDAGDVDRLFESAREAYLSLCANPAVAEALTSGDSLFEVPFSFRSPSSALIVRGTFDCLVRRRDGSILVLELKTGSPAPEHEQQLSVYLAAARALFPGKPVEGQVVYARQKNLDHRSLHSSSG